jgi:hypothetical protein
MGGVAGLCFGFNWSFWFFFFMSALLFRGVLLGYERSRQLFERHWEHIWYNVIVVLLALLLLQVLEDFYEVQDSSLCQN